MTFVSQNYRGFLNLATANTLFFSGKMVVLPNGNCEKSLSLDLMLIFECFEVKTVDFNL